MKTLDTSISSGMLPLIQEFMKANELVVELDASLQNLIIRYEDESESAIKLSFMAMIHSGVENMLCDYLLKCGIPGPRIRHGSVGRQESLKEVHTQFENHMKNLGFR